jgi:precorrin-2 dehydrogenase / sirohydrochlorin ferrochelatase
MKGFPVFLIGLENRRCIVIGGTHEGERKVSQLLDADADVTLISAIITDPLRKLADQRRIQWMSRDYQPGDLKDAFLVIAERRDATTNALIYEEATINSALVNVMDDVGHCNFVAGSVMQRGPLTIAISTNGCAPALAVRLRERLESQIGDEYGMFLDLVRDLREPLAARYPDFGERRAVWYRLVDGGVIDLLRDGDHREAVQRISDITGIEVVPAV